MSDSYPTLFDRAISVQLARALAEAADGLPFEFSPIYLASSYQPVADPLGGGFHVYGPYRSVDDLPPWIKDKVEDKEYGVFGPFEVTPKPADGSRVSGLDLQIEGHPTFSYPVLPDAVFLTAAAVEKFALPYYERIFGPRFAEKIALQFEISEVQVMAHYPWSEYTDGTRVPATPLFLRSTSSGLGLAPPHSSRGVPPGHGFMQVRPGGGATP